MTCRCEHWAIRELRVATGSKVVEQGGDGMRVFVGHDWAEAHHDVFVVDEAGSRLAAARVPEGIEGVARFHALVADHVDDPIGGDGGDGDRSGPVRGGAGGGGVSGAGGEPDVGGPLSGTACRPRVRSRMPATRGCWPNSHGSMGIIIARSAVTPSWRMRSRHWPGRISR